MGWLSGSVCQGVDVRGAIVRTPVGTAVHWAGPLLRATKFQAPLRHQKSSNPLNPPLIYSFQFRFAFSPRFLVRFSRFHCFTLGQEGTFFLLWSWILKLNLTYIWSVELKAKYVGQRSFCSKVIVITLTHTLYRLQYLDHKTIGQNFQLNKIHRTKKYVNSAETVGISLI